MKEQIILDIQDMTYLSWTKTRNSSGTAGSFLKAYSELGGIKTYYKLSNYDIINGVTGHECVNEIIVDRLLSILGIEHLKYQLIHSNVLINDKLIETYICSSNNFKESNEDKIALDDYYELDRYTNESPMDFCIRQGWKNYIYTMLVVDFLILNRDRHGANIEVLRNPDKHTIRLAPLFDHGMSLLCRCLSDEEVDRFNVIEDKKVQCFVGSNSSLNNLDLIPKSDLPKLNKLQQKDKDIILKDLEGVISNKLQNKIWDMIWKRWCYYENLCDKK